MVNDPKSAELKEKRAKVLREAEDQILLRLKEPWANKLFDLVLYSTMHAQGIRLTDIPRLIRKELEAIQ